MEATIITYVYIVYVYIVCTPLPPLPSPPLLLPLSCTFMYVSMCVYMPWYVCGQRATSSVVLALYLI